MPLISVIIPTYEKHYQYLMAAINSIDFESAEIIVVNDSLDRIDFDLPESTILINREDEESWGTGRARNIGADNAKGEAFLWLDSDDMFIPGAIKLLWDAYVLSKTPNNPGGNIVYGDLIRSDNNYYWQVKDQYCGNDIMKSALMISNRPYCCLISRIHHYTVGGYDENLPTYEDIDYEKLTNVEGICETHLNAAIYYYRWHSGERRNLGADEVLKRNVDLYIYEKYKDYHTGVKKLANCRKCGDQPISPYSNNQNRNQPKTLVNPAQDEVQYLVYIGGEPTHSIAGEVTGRTYRFGFDKRHSRKRIVDYVDVGPNEVNRDDARVFLPIRIHNRDQFKYETEVLIGENRSPRQPTPTLIRTPQIVEAETNTQLNSIFDVDSIVNYSINDIKDKLAEDEIPRSQLQLWLEEELRRGKDARSGMEKVLRVAIG